MRTRAIYSGHEAATLQQAKENFGKSARLISENEILAEKSKAAQQRPRVSARELRLIHATAGRTFQ